MIPGEIIPAADAAPLPGNAGLATRVLEVANTGDRPIQVGSHYHFAETNPALKFDRDKARGHRLDIAAGTAVRFEPGSGRDVTLIPYGGLRRVWGFNAKVSGELEPKKKAAPAKNARKTAASKKAPRKAKKTNARRR